MRFPPGIAPALFTRMSTPGNAAAILSTLALSERSAADTSTRTFDLRAISAWAALRSAAVRATSTTLQPSSAMALAVARPMPLEAPVMRAVLPASLRSMDEVSEDLEGRGARPYDPARPERNHVRRTCPGCAASLRFAACCAAPGERPPLAAGVEAGRTDRPKS